MKFEPNETDFCFKKIPLKCIQHVDFCIQASLCQYSQVQSSSPAEKIYPQNSKILIFLSQTKVQLFYHMYIKLLSGIWNLSVQPTFEFASL